MTYTWQSVTKNINVEDIGLKVNRRLDKIKMHVQHFPQNSVHLFISLQKNPKKELYAAALTLRLPSNILHAEKESANLMTAFDHAADALVREIKSLKSELRGEDEWTRKERRAVLRESKAAHFGPVPSREEVPEAFPEVLPELWEDHRSRLLFFVKQTLRRDEDMGRIPPGLIDPESVVDQVERIVKTDPNSRPGELSYKVWFHLLAEKELRRRYDISRDEAREAKHRAELNTASEMSAYRPSAPLEMRRRKFDPPPVPLSALVGTQVSIDDPAKVQQLWEGLQQEAESWPEENRAVFELHFLQGFEPSEVATLARLSPWKVKELVENVQQSIGNVVHRIGETPTEAMARA